MPDACLEEDMLGKCHVHFAFHGEGEQSLATRKTKYNHFAASNNIIMVYPRSYAAWDYKGEIDEDNYMTKDGVYPRVIMAMIERLGEGCPAEPEPPEPEPEHDCCLDEL